MDTKVRTPQEIFTMPQRLLVPLFQRPYVWNEELQWEPLWRDLQNVALRYLENPNAVQQPHFLGAVVFQQLQNPIGDLQQRTVIDGQQRLTTLTLILIKLFHLSEKYESKLSNWLRNKIISSSGYTEEFWMNHEAHKAAMVGLLSGEELKKIDVSSGITAQNMVNN
jgi:uncharacterized protein with ParB-like and HNH nuclease domain